MGESAPQMNGAKAPAKPSADDLRRSIAAANAFIDHRLATEPDDETWARLIRGVAHAIIRWRFEEDQHETGVDVRRHSLARVMAWMLANELNEPDLPFAMRIGLFAEIGGEAVGRATAMLAGMIDAEQRPQPPTPVATGPGGHA